MPQLPEAYREELLSPEAIAERLKLWDERSSKMYKVEYRAVCESRGSGFVG